MKTALVLGGTRFFGKRLVIDRYNRESMEKAVNGNRWDVVYDQICYAPNDAIDACNVFEGKTDKYIFTSTLSVYVAKDEAWHEEEVDPYIYPLQMGQRTDFDYGEGKRLAEAVCIIGCRV